VVIAIAALATILALGAKWGVVDRVERPSRVMEFAEMPEGGIGTPLGITFGDQVTLLGYTLSRERARPGEVVFVRLSWRLAGLPIADEYATIIEARDPNGLPIAEVNSGYDIPFQTSSWVPGTVIVERLALRIPPGTPPIAHPITVRLYAPRTGAVPEAVDAAGRPLGSSPALATLAVVRPLRPATPADLGIDQPLNTPLAGDVMLVSADTTPSENEVGQPFFLIAHWRAEQGRPDQGYSTRLVWLDQENEVAAESPPFEPVPGLPTDQWQPGDVWTSQHLLYVPGRLEAGDYGIGLELLRPSGESERRIRIGSMTVGAPPRTFDPPTPQHEAGVEWANGIRLLGYDLLDAPLAPGESLALTLYWQPQRDLDANLSTFVHLIDASGEIAAQHDGVPLSGARPTLGWASGEVIADRIETALPADLPPGTYALRVGWYEAASGVRVRVEDSGEFWPLPVSVEVAP